MTVSVLISTFNGVSDIDPLLESIAKLRVNGITLQVILRDDGSTDGTADRVCEAYPWVQCIRGTKTLGFVQSNNLAFKAATGTIICCVNQDTVLHPDFIVAGIAPLREQEDAAAVNTNMIMPWIMSLEAFRRSDLGTLPAYEYQMTPWGFARYVRVDTVLRRTTFVTGGGCFVRRDVLANNEDLFDSRLSMYCEDNELALRLQRAGGYIVYAPQAVIYHNQRSKRLHSTAAARKLLRITANRFHVLAMHHTPGALMLAYPRYTIGIVLKMRYLGLDGTRRMVAYVAGTALAAGYLLMAPYWIWRAGAASPQFDDMSDSIHEINTGDARDPTTSRCSQGCDQKLGQS